MKRELTVGYLFALLIVVVPATQLPPLPNPVPCNPLDPLGQCPLAQSAASQVSGVLNSTVAGVQGTLSSLAGGAIGGLSQTVGSLSGGALGGLGGGGAPGGLGGLDMLGGGGAGPTGLAGPTDSFPAGWENIPAGDLTPPALEQRRQISTFDRAALHQAIGGISPPSTSDLGGLARLESPALREAEGSGRTIRGRTEAQRARLTRLADQFLGTRDVAGAAEGLLDMPFVWLSPEARAPEDPSLFITLTPQEFLHLEALTSIEFTHFAAWLAGDRPGRVAPGSDGTWSDRVAWRMDRGTFETRGTAWDGGAIPRGVLVWGAGEAAVSLGDGAVIGLGAEGLLRRPIREAFPELLYPSLRVSPYPWERQPPSRTRDVMIREALQDVAWKGRS